MKFKPIEFILTNATKTLLCFVLFSFLNCSSDDKGAHLAWANTLNGEEDLYYSRILLTEAAIVNIDATTVASIAITPNPGSGIFHICRPCFTLIN